VNLISFDFIFSNFKPGRDLGRSFAPPHLAIATETLRCVTYDVMLTDTGVHFMQYTQQYRLTSIHTFY